MIARKIGEAMAGVGVPGSASSKGTFCTLTGAVHSSPGQCPDFCGIGLPACANSQAGRPMPQKSGLCRMLGPEPSAMQRINFRRDQYLRPNRTKMPCRAPDRLCNAFALRNEFERGATQSHSFSVRAALRQVPPLP